MFTTLVINIPNAYCAHLIIQIRKWMSLFLLNLIDGSMWVDAVVSELGWFVLRHW